MGPSFYGKKTVLKKGDRLVVKESVKSFITIAFYRHSSPIKLNGNDKIVLPVDTINDGLRIGIIIASIFGLERTRHIRKDADLISIEFC
jgi:hypothetical protein